jgi:hypothetical protein
MKITICHEKGDDVKWKDCAELVVGRIRPTPEWNGEDTDVLSLALFPGTFLEFSMDDRWRRLSSFVSQFCFSGFVAFLISNRIICTQCRASVFRYLSFKKC